MREKEDTAIKGASLSLLLFTSPQNGSLECLSACSHPPLVGDCPRGVNSPKGVGSAGSKALEKDLRQRERERDAAARRGTLPECTGPLRPQQLKSEMGQKDAVCATV